MSLFDDDKPIKKLVHEIGMDLSAMASDELKARIALLKDEIARIETELSQKSSSRSSAESLFKR